MNKILNRKKGQNVTEYMAQLVKGERDARYDGNYELVTAINKKISEFIETDEYKNDLKMKMGIRN